MSIVPNHTKHLLQAGKLALGLGLRTSRTVDIAMAAARERAGFLRGLDGAR